MYSAPQKRRIIHDSIYLGLFLGTVLPFLGCLIYKEIEFSTFQFDQFLDFIARANAISKLISICIIINLPALYVLSYFKYILALRGIVLMTIIYALTAFVFLFI